MQHQFKCGNTVAHPVVLNFDGSQHECCDLCARALTARVHEQKQRVMESVEEANAAASESE